MQRCRERIKYLSHYAGIKIFDNLVRMPVLYYCDKRALEVYIWYNSFAKDPGTTKSHQLLNTKSSNGLCWKNLAAEHVEKHSKIDLGLLNMQKLHMIRKLPICALFAMSLSKTNHPSSYICWEIINLCEGAEVVFLECSIIVSWFDCHAITWCFSNCEFTWFQH